MSLPVRGLQNTGTERERSRRQAARAGRWAAGDRTSLLVDSRTIQSDSSGGQHEHNDWHVLDVAANGDEPNWKRLVPLRNSLHLLQLGTLPQRTRSEPAGPTEEAACRSVRKDMPAVTHLSRFQVTCTDRIVPEHFRTLHASIAPLDQ